MGHRRPLQWFLSLDVSHIWIWEVSQSRQEGLDGRVASGRVEWVGGSPHSHIPDQAAPTHPHLPTHTCARPLWLLAITLQGKGQWKSFLHFWHNDIVQHLDVVAILQSTSELKDMHFVCSSHKCSWSAKSTTLSSVRLWHSGVSDKALTSEMWPVWQLLPPQRMISKDIPTTIL